MSKRSNRRAVILLPILGFFLQWVSLAEACTLFGAIGKSVEGGGVLIGKTRDRPQDLEQVFVEMAPKGGGYRYRGIATPDRVVVTSGVNEKNLVVVSAAASNVARENKVTSCGKILSKASSVDDVIQMVRGGEIQGPVHFLAADVRHIAVIEIMDRSRHDVVVGEEGVFCHTNHFVLEGMKDLNPKVGPSSSARLTRIQGLLAKGPFTKDQFIAFSRDHFNGPGNLSICRHAEKGKTQAEKTVSAAVYYLHKEQPAELWVSLGQPCQSTFEKR